MSMLSAQDRRTHQRLESEADFKDTTWAYPSKGLFSSLFRERFPGSIVDVSQGGIGLLTTKQVKVNDYLEVQVYFRDFESFGVEGRVRKCDVFDTAMIDGKKVEFFKVGLQLENIKPEYQENMKKIVALIKVREGG